MDYESKFKSYDKRKLVKLLDKEGIAANTSQSKSELVRMLVLAKKANSPTKKHFRNAHRDKFYKILANFLEALSNSCIPELCLRSISRTS